MGHKKINLERVGVTGEKILVMIAQSGLTTVDLVLSSYIDAFFQRGLFPVEEVTPSYTIKRTLKKLIQRGILEETGNAIGLTKSGRWEVARRRMLDDPEKHTAQYWDKKWRVVIFDIPELERSNRDRLRRSFHRYGFYLLQKSVWVYPYACDNFIESLKTDLGFSAEVLYMTVECIENQEKLQEEFGLL